MNRQKRGKKETKTKKKSGKTEKSHMTEQTEKDRENWIEDTTLAKSIGPPGVHSHSLPM